MAESVVGAGIRVVELGKSKVVSNRVAVYRWSLPQELREPRHRKRHYYFRAIQGKASSTSRPATATPRFSLVCCSRRSAPIFSVHRGTTFRFLLLYCFAGSGSLWRTRSCCFTVTCCATCHFRCFPLLQVACDSFAALASLSPTPSRPVSPLLWLVYITRVFAAVPATPACIA